jgi:hypothetical protein
VRRRAHYQLIWMHSPGMIDIRNRKLCSRKTMQGTVEQDAMLAGREEQQKRKSDRNQTTSVTLLFLELNCDPICVSVFNRRKKLDFCVILAY